MKPRRRLDPDKSGKHLKNTIDDQYVIPDRDIEESSLRYLDARLRKFTKEPSEGVPEPVLWTFQVGVTTFSEMRSRFVSF